MVSKALPVGSVRCMVTLTCAGDWPARRRTQTETW
jgi:hypothetical protein